MRTTSGANADCANDRPPHDATFAQRLRAAGAIILGKTNLGEYAGAYKSSFGGIAVTPYDPERQPSSSSGGAAVAVATNLVTCAIGGETPISIRDPARRNSAVGIMATHEWVSRHRMMQSGINPHIGPIAGRPGALAPTAFGGAAADGIRPTLKAVISSYEQATHHRRPPPEFGPVVQ